jgi:biotin transport system substrate-specific component
MQPMSAKDQALQPLSAPRAGSQLVLSVIASTALVAICAHISVPLGFTPVPFTMQTFAVLLLGLVLGPGAACASMALYLLEGALGLPVFSPHGPGGLAQLLGPSGGYLLAYPLAALLSSIVYRRLGRSSWSALASATLANLLILGVGALWLASLAHAALPVVLAQSVVPFLPGDALKLVAAAVCARVLKSFTSDLRTRTL